jgi:hypothetical protein
MSSSGGISRGGWDVVPPRGDDDARGGEGQRRWHDVRVLG